MSFPFFLVPGFLSLSHIHKSFVCFIISASFKSTNITSTHYDKGIPIKMKLRLLKTIVFVLVLLTGTTVCTSKTCPNADTDEDLRHFTLSVRRWFCGTTINLVRCVAIQKWYPPWMSTRTLRTVQGWIHRLPPRPYRPTLSATKNRMVRCRPHAIFGQHSTITFGRTPL